MCYFTRHIATQFYESSDGFSVEVLGRTGLRDREAGLGDVCTSEVLSGLSGMAVYKHTIQKWDLPKKTSQSVIQTATEFLTTFAIPFAPKDSRLM